MNQSPAGAVLAPAEKRREARKVAAASLIGTTIEYYDFSIYGAAAAIVLAHLFFPAGDPAAGTLAAFATFAAAFLARPIGVIVFGNLGDRLGRKPALVISLLMMGGATIAVGLLPTFGTVGLLAPILLVTCRILQGIGLGGEWGGAVLLASEHAPPNRRAVYAAVTQAGPPLGVLLANGVFAAVTASMSEEAFMAWGWRVPFLLSFVMIAIGMWIRSQVNESPLFTEAQERDEGPERFPMGALLRGHAKRLVIGVGAALAGSALWYLMTVYSVSYGVSVGGVAQSTMLLVVSAAALVHLVLIVPMAHWAERVGRRLPMLIGAVALAVWAFPMFLFMGTGDPWLMVLGFGVGGVVHTLLYAPVSSYLAELFPTRVRYSGAGSAFVLASILGGGFAPMIASALIGGGESPVRLALYALVLALLTFTALWFGPETKDTDMAE
ncbi:MFS transporter [Marinactinospora thermotolerans]|uniref:Putative proline/betaine transporter n=1 Tax=Marinactinospora thermotolerans DSM 45154 TaxID=1122192 RepID=A0A1T4LT51_9ACTN|nr:MFS transporter [Marinactinospora thermotolerans]SJZ57837.1 metabolite-proton symporter [Marinactinospora thermotolerans DSM 45154]